MRPAGYFSQLLLQALEKLAAPDRGVTLQELAEHTQIGKQIVRNLIPKMKLHGRIRISGERRVPGRNRPAAEYALPVQQPAANDAVMNLSAAMRVWG